MSSCQAGGFGGVRAGAFQPDGRALRQRRQLFDAESEQVPPRCRIAAEADPVLGVDDSGEEGDEGGAAVGHETADVLRTRVRDEIKRGHQDEPVAGQVALRVGEVRVHPGLQERPVQLAKHVGKVQGVARMRVELQRPPVLPVEQQRGLGGHPVAGHRGEPP